MNILETIERHLKDLYRNPATASEEYEEVTNKGAFSLGVRLAAESVLELIESIKKEQKYKEDL